MATRITNISTKYKDLVSKSILTSSGKPVVYQLKPKKETIGNLTRLVFPGPNLKKEKRNILIVGETGAGKSTLINCLFNYTLGVKFEDDIWFQIVEEEENDQTESLTSDVIVYENICSEAQTHPYSLTIIDTPGYGSTAGIERDVVVSQRLFDLFQSDDGIHEIHAVGLVVKSSVNRLIDTQRYIFDSVMSLFGKDLEKNIVVLITHSDGKTPKNALKAIEGANIKCAKNEKNQPLHFLFDNCQHEDRSEEEDMETLKRSFDLSQKGFNKLVNFIGSVEPQRLGTTLDVLNKRLRLAACINNLQERINLIELKQKEIKQTGDALEKCEDQLKNDKNFNVEVEEVYQEKEKVGRGLRWFLIYYDGVTHCEVCEQNCHYPCEATWYPSRCTMMENSKCTVCTKKCHVKVHVKDQWRYVPRTRKVKRTLEDVKKHYEIQQEDISGVLTGLKEEIKKLEKEMDEYLEEAYQHLITLKQIALNSVSLSTYVHLDVLIEKMEEKGEKEKVQMLKEMNSRQDQAVKTVMTRFYSGIKSVFG